MIYVLAIPGIIWLAIESKNFRKALYICLGFLAAAWLALTIIQ